MREPSPGRDPEDSLDHRLDAGPPSKPGAVIIPLIVVKLDTVARLIKKLLRIK
jgi:hypothetical protein